MPYGFPSGEGLVQEILATKRISTHGEDHLVPEITPHKGSREKTQKDLDLFLQLLKGASEYSIDAFMQARPELAYIGRALIAKVILGHQSEDTITNPGLGENWYKYLISKIMDPRGNIEFEDDTDEKEKRKKLIELFCMNKVAFITFNYDFSLEHFITTTMKNRFDLDQEGLGRMYKNLPIIHIYGTIGDYQPDLSRYDLGNPYDGTPNHISSYNKNISLYIRGTCIRTIRDTQQKNGEATRAVELLSNAQKIIFMGFGYDETNVNLLFPSGMRLRSGFIGGTSHGMETSEIRRTHDLFRQVVGTYEPGTNELGRSGQIPLNLEPTTCLEYLRKQW